MRKLAVLTVAVGAALATANIAQAALVSNGSLPLHIGVFVPCANGGAGEIVNLTGNLHMLSTATLDSSGGTQVTSLINPQDVSGVGSVSGAGYRGTGVTLTSFEASVGTVTTFVNNFLIIGAGGAGSFRVHENIAVVVNANGTVTATVDNFRATCD